MSVCALFKHMVNGEIPDRRESLLLSLLVEHSSTDGRGVCAEDVLLGFFDLPVILVPLIVHVCV